MPTIAQGWVKLKPGARNSVQVSHVGGKHSKTGALSAASQK